MTTTDLRQLLDVAYRTCDIIESRGLWRVGEFRMRNLLRLDIAKFLMYLSFSDEQVSLAEVDFFADVLDYYTDAEEIIQIVKENHIYSTEFETTPPPVIKGASVAQKQLIAYGIVPRRRIVDLIIECFKRVGLCFILCDGADERKERDFNIYMKTLNEYVKASEIVECTDYTEYTEYSDYSNYGDNMNYSEYAGYENNADYSEYAGYSSYRRYSKRRNVN